MLFSENLKSCSNMIPTFTMRARILLIALILLRPASVASLRGAWPLRPLGRRFIRRKGRGALMSLHYPNIVRRREILSSLG
jgi:hypothetical protein